VSALALPPTRDPTRGCAYRPKGRGLFGSEAETSKDLTDARGVSQRDEASSGGMDTGTRTNTDSSTDSGSGMESAVVAPNATSLFHGWARWSSPVLGVVESISADRGKEDVRRMEDAISTASLSGSDSTRSGSGNTTLGRQQSLATAVSMPVSVPGPVQPSSLGTSTDEAIFTRQHSLNSNTSTKTSAGSKGKDQLTAALPSSFNALGSDIDNIDMPQPTRKDFSLIREEKTRTAVRAAHACAR
jgi:hypothetical protein